LFSDLLLKLKLYSLIHIKKNFLDQFDDIPLGMTIYDVYAYAMVNDPNPVLLGSLNVTEKFVRSYWGDRYMFFQHNFIFEDYKYRPDFQTMGVNEYKTLMQFFHSDI